ncbi:MAG: hypothetical protein ACSLFQ_22150 [Thermoanaerobaculia bacterium]
MPAEDAPAKGRDSMDEVIEVYKRDVDRTLLRENLAKTPTERLQTLQQLQRFAEELRRAGSAERNKRG